MATNQTFEPGLDVLRTTSNRHIVTTRLAARLTSFVVALLGILIASQVLPDLDSRWLVVVAVGAVAGSISGRPSEAWIALLAVAAAHVVAQALQLNPVKDPVWLWHLTGLAALTTFGFVLGTAVGWRGDRIDASVRRWRELSGRSRQLIVGVAIGLVIGPVVCGTATAVVAVDVWAAGKTTDCRTPMYAYGWPYEAINYDVTADSRLLPLAELADDGVSIKWTCGWAGATAGRDVVSEGVGIAGWYIPAAARDIAASGPTVVIVPGGKSNKSESLIYAVALHDAYNIVMFDNRGMGQSGPADLTMGIKEQSDVHAIVDWVEDVKGPSWIAVVSNSMGAAAALAEATGDERVHALVLDSMHATAVATIGRILESEKSLPAFPTAWEIVAITSLRLGRDVAAIDPVRLIGSLGRRPVLLVHGTGDEIDRPAESAELNFHAALAAGVPVELRYCGGTHGHLVTECPEWGSWVRSFLSTAQTSASAGGTGPPS